MPAPQRIPTNTTIHKTQRLQAGFKEAHQLYRETVDVENLLTKQIVAVIEKKYLQVIYDKITKSITKLVLGVIQHLFKNYDQVRQTTLNEHRHRVKAMVYTLIEALSTVFTQIEDIIMLDKSAKNP